MSEPPLPAAASSDGTTVQQPFNLRWTCFGLSFSLSERKFIVIRERGSRAHAVHFTMAYKTASGQVDLHLKREPVLPGEDPYIRLAQIAPEQLASVGELLGRIWEPAVREMLDHWKPTSPGWLSRRGYTVMLAERNVSPEPLHALVAGKRRGKHVLTFEPLKDPKYFRQFADYIYPAWILRHVPPDLVQLPIHASVVGRKKRRQPLLIGSFEIDGRERWLMIPKARIVEMTDKVMADVMSLMGAAWSPAISALIETVIAELALDELPGVREMASGLLELAAAPQVAVATARRRAKAWTRPKRRRESFLVRYRRLGTLKRTRHPPRDRGRQRAMARERVASSGQ